MTELAVRVPNPSIFFDGGVLNSRFDIFEEMRYPVRTDPAGSFKKEISMINSIVNYFKSAKEELEKVSWPTQNDVVRYSTIIVTVTAVLAIFFATLDFGLSKGVSTVLSKRFQGQSVSQNETPTTEPIDVKATTAEDANGNPINVQTIPTSDTNAFKK